MRIDQPTVADSELALLRELCRGKTVLELGSGRGFATLELALVADLVVTVDWHRGDDMAGPGDTLQDFLNRTYAARLAGRVVPIVGRIERVLPVLAPAWFDVIFHDAHHSAESVSQDLRLALPLLSWDGYVAVHDFGLYGVEEATRAILGAPDQRVRTLAAWGPNLGRWHIAGARPGADAREAESRV